MNKSTKSTLFRINNANVVWSNLSKPDEFKGTIKHDISVVISPEEKAEMEKLTGATRIAGIRDGQEGDIICKAKTTVFTKAGEIKFPKVYDSETNLIDTIIGRGDTVNVNVSLYEYDPGSFTVMLNAVQLVAKNPEFAQKSGGTSGFGVVEGGYVGDAAAPADEAPAPAADTSPAAAGGVTEDLPF